MPIYLDYNATTPVYPEVSAAIQPFLHGDFGNPSSSHAFGQRAREAVAEARAAVAALIGARPEEIVFTGSATEANNLALLGVARALPHKRHLVVGAIEHPAVMAPARYLESLGWDLTVVAVDNTGRVAPNDIRAALRPETALVSIMHANNEVGTLQAIAEIAALARANGSLMHTDAAQSVGKLPIDVRAFGVDLLTVAGHKFGATKGVGALYVREGTPIRSILFGADQEHGLRPGTENVPAIVGLGAAARLAHARLPGLTAELAAKRDRLHRRLADAIPGLALNGHPLQRLPNTLHLSFPGVSGRDLLAAVEGLVAASVGSACHSGDDAVSGVLAAMGFPVERARGALRLSVGMSVGDAEIDQAAALLIGAWAALKEGLAAPR
jgi:cysteine desulfurase